MPLVRVKVQIYLGTSRKAIAKFDLDENTIGGVPELGALVAKELAKRSFPQLASLFGRR